MSVSIQIVPLSPSLHMFGDADPLSAYSLSGHVAISLSSPHSFFSARRTARVLLQSVSLTFEGQAEISTPDTGYAATRLCQITRELAPSEPTELTNLGHEEDSPCQWNVIFNLPIPGWLPSTCTIGTEELGTRYALYATAKFISLDDDHHRRSWSLATLCAPFRSRIRSVEAAAPITIHRFIPSPEPQAPVTNYLVNPNPKSSPNIPTEVLSKIQVLASVPECVNVERNSVPVTLRMRTKDLTEEQCKRLQIADLSIDIIQHEKTRIRPSPAYLASYPLPPLAQQPPNLPLRDPHPSSTLYDLALLHTTPSAEAITRSFSLLPQGDDGVYKLASNNYAFLEDHHDATPTWYTMETNVSFAHRSSANVDEEQAEWAGPAVVRPTAVAPLFSVYHDVKVNVTFLYDLPGGEQARETLGFSVPLRFGRYAAPSTTTVVTSRTSLEGSRTSVEGSRTSVGASRTLVEGSRTSTERSRTSVEAQRTSVESCLSTTSSMESTLPPYSQLYDSNGDRKIDYSVPLPLYTPPSPLPVYATILDGCGRDCKTGVSL